ncbi:MAG: efflux RND transporter permease subunit [Saprospiraceae bacterium]|nr:efflux RND transporter permease subunit [Saprospiraceae bacterium]
MIRYLIQRPVAVLLSFALLLGLGVYFFNKISVSLLPTIDVPRIVITTSYPDHTASEIEIVVLKPLLQGV